MVKRATMAGRVGERGDEGYDKVSGLAPSRTGTARDITRDETSDIIVAPCAILRGSTNTRVIILISLASAAGIMIVLLVGFFAAARLVPKPEHVGRPDRPLAPCPATPNCVSSRSDEAPHAMAPIRYHDVVPDPQARLVKVIDQMPRATIVTKTPGYVHAEFRSTFFGFVDDVEFRIVESERVIHFRSASRLGRSDLGVNRERMDRIRALFDTAQT